MLKNYHHLFLRKFVFCSFIFVFYSFIFVFYSFISLSCAKKPKFYVEGKISADDEIALYAQASYDIKRGRLPEAEQKLELLVSTGEKEGKQIGFYPYYQLALLKYRLKKIDEGKFYAQKAEKFAQTEVEFENIYQLWIWLGEVKQALESLKTAISNFPQNEGFFRMLITDYIRHGRTKEAKELAEKFIEKNPQNLSALIIYGSLLKNEGEIKKAKEIFEKIIALGHFPEQVIKELVEIYRNEGELKKAIELLGEVDRIYPSLFIKRELVELLLEVGENEKAVRYMDEIADEVPEPEILLDRLKVLFRAKKYPELLSSSEHLIKLSIGNKDRELIILMRAYSLEKLKKFEEAIEEYDKIDKSSEFYSRAIAGKIDCLREIDPNKALIFTQEIQDEIITPDIAQSIVFIFRDKEDYGKALELLERYIKRFDNSSELIYTKTLILYESGAIEEAIKNADILLEKEKENPNYLNLKGYIMLELIAEEKEKNGVISIEKLEEAGMLIKKAFEKKPTDPYIKDSMGWYLFLRGDIDGAEKYISEALKELPEDAVICEHMADIFIRKGEFEEALKLYKNGLEKGKPKGEDRKRIERKLKELMKKIEAKNRNQK